MSSIIEAKGLVKRFGDFIAVDGVSITVEKGEIFGFLGQNGAGKTTTIRMLTTLLKPDEGTIVIGGHDASKEPMEVKSMIGICPQHISLDKDISLYENIRYKSMLLGMSKKDATARIEELTELMGLEPYMDRIAYNLSGGCKRKGVIVCSILHQPKVLFLDEPTSGLDTQSRHLLWELIRILKEKGTTVILTTHYIEEAEALSDKIAIISHGKIVLEGTPDELCHNIGKWTVEYIDENEVRCFKYFNERKEASEFFDTCGDPERTLLRKTHLEDVFLETTGRDNFQEDA
ncbi:MAG: ATP-binding cassette domain-containing protein [Candidatus Methanogranum gryphiswaldense]|nr:MAG: ATP-binding cassette domain-containing protein [Candidatus Methanogranum sp. U3.2.1]